MVAESPARMCEKLVGLGEVDLVGIGGAGEGSPLQVVIRFPQAPPVLWCLWWAGVL